MERIKEQLEDLAEEEFRCFTQKLLPGVDGVLGVRLPKLRIIAKRLAKTNWSEYLEKAPEDSFEEVMLKGMVIGYIKGEQRDIFQLIREFVPKIDNWSVCDSFCSGLKMTRDCQEEMLEFLEPYLMEDREYFARFGIVMLIFYYIEENYIDRVLVFLNRVPREGYYVKMALAWAVSAAYVRFPGKTDIFLRRNELDDFTYHKALQKITESHCIDRETKDKIRSLRRM